MTSVLRTVFSVSWIVVPPLAGWLAAAYSIFDIFAAAALAHVGCVLLFGLLLTDPGARVGSAQRNPSDAEPAGPSLPAGGSSGSAA